MTLDVGYDEEQRAFAAAVRALGERLSDEWAAPATFPERTWRELGRIGLFELAGDDAAAVELAAVLEELGRLGCPGPLWETVFAVRALDPELVGSIVDGSAVASVGSADLLPWGARAQVVLERGADDVWLCAGRPAGAAVRVLTGEVWTAATLVRQVRVEPARALAATALAEMALAAYLAGAAGRIVRDAAAYLAVRRQFGRPLGDLQAVAFPLAECDVAVEAARALTRRAAAGIAAGAPPAIPSAAPLLSAVRAARSTVATGFQLYGALGFTEESDFVRAARRITQLAVAGLPAWRRRAAVDEVRRAT